jgi:hypothetical protein
MGRDGDRDGVDDRRGTTAEGRTDYEQGRLDERRDDERQGGRFSREETPDRDRVQ